MRTRKAREHGFHATWDAMRAEAARLTAAGKLWSDPHFSHDDSSLFRDADDPPVDWLRDGERGKVLKNVRVEWRAPKDFCLSKRPLGKSQASGAPTWLYDDSGSVAENQTADDVQQGSLGAERVRVCGSGCACAGAGA